MASSFRYSTPDKGYVKEAGRIAGKTISDIPEMMAADADRKRLNEQLKQLRVDREKASKIREDFIAEKSVEYMEAVGLEGDEGRQRALAVISQHVPPMMGSERANPTVFINRMLDNEKKIDQTINKEKVDRYKKETSPQSIDLSGQPITPYKGRVAVDDDGVQRTSAFPQSIEEMQAEELNAPRTIQRVDYEPTAEDAYGIAREMDIEQQPTIQADIQRMGRKEVTDTEYPEGTYQPTVMRDALRKPVVDPAAVKYGETYPKELTELDKLKLDIAKIRKSAARSGSTADIDRNIRWATDRVDELDANIIKNNEKINRLRQARVRLMANQTLSTQQMQGLQSDGFDMENITPDRIGKEINKLQLLVNSSSDAKRAAEETSKELAKGRPLAEARRKEEEFKEGQEVEKADKMKVDAKRARQIINTSFKDVLLKGTMEDVINKLPEELRESVRILVQKAKDSGADDLDIRRYWGGSRTK